MREESKEKLSKFMKGKIAWNKGKDRAWKVPGAFKKGDTKGEKNFKWKGGRYKSTQGYIFILKPEHPRANCRGYVAEHTLVAENGLGRFLLRKEEVHHINGDKTDNRFENFIVFPNRSEHTKFHNIEKERDKTGKFSKS